MPTTQKEYEFLNKSIADAVRRELGQGEIGDEMLNAVEELTEGVRAAMDDDSGKWDGRKHFIDQSGVADDINRAVNFCEQWRAGLRQ